MHCTASQCRMHSVSQKIKSNIIFLCNWVSPTKNIFIFQRTICICENVFFHIYNFIIYMSSIKPSLFVIFRNVDFILITHDQLSLIHSNTVQTALFKYRSCIMWMVLGVMFFSFLLCQCININLWNRMQETTATQIWERLGFIDRWGQCWVKGHVEL